MIHHYSLVQGVSFDFETVYTLPHVYLDMHMHPYTALRAETPGTEAHITSLSALVVHTLFALSATEVL